MINHILTSGRRALEAMTKSICRAKPMVKPKLMITEGVESLWHYHLSYDNTKSRGLCGARTMYTTIHVEDWRVPFGEDWGKQPTWCTACEQIKLTLGSN